MRARPTLAAIRLGLACLGAIAVGAQLLALLGRGTFSPVNFFSYFTIQGNLVAIVALVLAVTASDASRARVDRLRGGATVYMTVTGVVYALLLQGTDVDTTIPWVNTVVHVVMPVVVVVDWLIDPPAGRMVTRDWLAWLAYPVAWVAYTMVRGPIAGWYPYPFLDPAHGGYGPVLVTVAAIFVSGAGLCWLVATAGNALGSRDPDGRHPRGAEPAGS
jgi:hypothetical protein